MKKVVIGVISDTHIPIKAPQIPQKVLTDFKEADIIIHAGDLTDLSVLDSLNKICKDVQAVQGNMDSIEIKMLLPEKLLLKINDFKIGVIHGFGSPANLINNVTEIFKNDAVDLIIFGHSHSALIQEKDGVLYFNPGSPVDTVFAPYNSYGIIEITDKIDAKIIKL